MSMEREVEADARIEPALRADSLGATETMRTFKHPALTLAENRSRSNSPTPNFDAPGRPQMGPILHGSANGAIILPPRPREDTSIVAKLDPCLASAFINAALGRYRSVCLASELSPIHREQH